MDFDGSSNGRGKPEQTTDDTAKRGTLYRDSLRAKKIQKLITSRA